MTIIKAVMLLVLAVVATAHDECPLGNPLFFAFLFSTVFRSLSIKKDWNIIEPKCIFI